MRLFWGILFFFFALGAHAQIVVDTGTYTVEQLIRDILINSNCAETSNYRSFTGTDQGVNGIGHFNANGSGFQYEAGIVLSTGNAEDSEGPNNQIYNTRPSDWTGDSDLTIITGRQELFNASYIQFDFIPRTNSISFNFLFASEEYDDDYQCNFSDVFAFILTGPDGVSENLALLPDTDVPVSVTSIRPGIVDLCPPENSAYFAGINGLDSAISQHGQTVGLTAKSIVTPNQTYTIKLVIADNRDSELDSAVFLEAGSFTIDVSLGPDRTIAGGNPLCVGETVELDATSQGAIDYVWYRDDNEMTQFRNQPILEVNETGVYRVEVVFSVDCIANGNIVLEYVEIPIISEEPVNLVACDLDGDGMDVFDFTINTNLILGNQNSETYQVNYYHNRVDAENFENEIMTPSAYTGNLPNELIYARISAGNSCYAITSFELRIQTLATIPTLEPQYPLCIDENGMPLEPFPLLEVINANDAYEFIWYEDVISDETEIDEATTAQYTASSAGTYHVVLRNIAVGCEFSLSTEVVTSSPPEDFEVHVVSDLFSDSNTIEILTQGDNTYLYSIDDGPYGDNNRFSDVGVGAHMAHVTDANGCGIISKEFFIIGYPKFFTPNNDGRNDIWTIAGLAQIEGAEVSVYNRYGMLIYEFFDGLGWNGFHNGKILPSDDYWFKIAYVEEGISKEFKGHFALKR